MVMVKNLSIVDFEKEIRKEDSVLLDVRTPMEFNSGHIPNSINLDIYSNSVKSDIDKLDKDKIYLIYCRTGARSYNMCDYMNQLGYNTVNMEKGIVSWFGEIDR